MAASIRQIKGIKELALFRVDGMMFGIDIVHIQEINKNMAYTRVHDAASYIKGVLNLRGQIVTVMDMRTLFNRNTQEISEADRRMLIVNFHDECVGLLVDEVDDIINTEASRIEQGSTQMGGVDPDYFAGVYKLESDVVIILDIEHILNVDEDSVAA